MKPTDRPAQKVIRSVRRKKPVDQSTEFRPKHLLVAARVTRFGDFSPIGRLFSLGILFNAEIAQILGHPFFTVKVMFRLRRKRFGQHFGRLFNRLIWSPWFQPTSFYLIVILSL
jgi:hypothetical protein